MQQGPRRLGEPQPPAGVGRDDTVLPVAVEVLGDAPQQVGLSAGVAEQLQENPVALDQEVVHDLCFRGGAFAGVALVDAGQQVGDEGEGQLARGQREEPFVALLRQLAEYGEALSAGLALLPVPAARRRERLACLLQLDLGALAMVLEGSSLGAEGVHLLAEIGELSLQFGDLRLLLGWGDLPGEASLEDARLGDEPLDDVQPQQGLDGGPQRLAAAGVLGQRIERAPGWRSGTPSCRSEAGPLCLWRLCCGNLEMDEPLQLRLVTGEVRLDGLNEFWDTPDRDDVVEDIRHHAKGFPSPLPVNDENGQQLRILPFPIDRREHLVLGIEGCVSGGRLSDLDERHRFVQVGHYKVRSEVIHNSGQSLVLVLSFEWHGLVLECARHNRFEQDPTDEIANDTLQC